MKRKATSSAYPKGNKKPGSVSVSGPGRESERGDKALQGQSQGQVLRLGQLEDGSDVRHQRPGVAVVYDRRINLHNFGEAPSMFELCRAWVQDDPDRARVSVASKYISRSDLRAAEEETEFDRVITYLTKAMRTPKTEDFSTDHVNSLEGIDPKDILSLHLLHFKKGRKIRRTLALAKYGRLAALNNSRADNYPLQELIERLAAKTNTDVALQDLMKNLGQHDRDK